MLSLQKNTLIDYFYNEVMGINYKEQTSHPSLPLSLPDEILKEVYVHRRAVIKLILILGVTEFVYYLTKLGLIDDAQYKPIAEKTDYVHDLHEAWKKYGATNAKEYPYTVNSVALIQDIKTGKAAMQCFFEKDGKFTSVTFAKKQNGDGIKINENQDFINHDLPDWTMDTLKDANDRGVPMNLVYIIRLQRQNNPQENFTGMGIGKPYRDATTNFCSNYCSETKILSRFITAFVSSLEAYQENRPR